MGCFWGLWHLSHQSTALFQNTSSLESEEGTEETEVFAHLSCPPDGLCKRTMNLLRNIKGHLKPCPDRFPGRTPRWLRRQFHWLPVRLQSQSIWVTFSKVPNIPNPLLNHMLINDLLFILKQQLSSGTALRTPTSAKKPLLLNLPSTGSPQRVCPKLYTPPSSSISFTLFPGISVLIHLHGLRRSCLFL